MKPISLKQELPKGYDGPVSNDSGDDEERYPSLYIDWVDDLPKLEAGQEVILKGKVKEFTQTDSDSKENPYKCVIEVQELTPKTSVKADSRNFDEDDVEKGLKESENALEDDKEE